MTAVSNVLLVDDYEVNLELLEAYLTLSEIPLCIYKAHTGAEAYQYIEKENLDLILLDVMLPDTSGYDICRHLKGFRLYQNIPVIILTALNDKQSMIEGLQAGADEFLTKPVDSYELILRVKNLLKMKCISNDLDEKYKQLHKELVIATELQKSFLPKKIPMYESFQIEVLYKPSSFIGGDFYDFLQIDKEHLGILICDVKGHGVASAMITATIKFQLHGLEYCYLQPEVLLKNLNERLEHFFSNTANDYFVTAVYAVLDVTTWQLCYSNAGHTYPCWCHEDQLMMLENQQGLPLGILENSFYDCQEINLKNKDELFFYTDGIFEIELCQKPEKSCTGLMDFFDGKEASPNAQGLHQLQQEIKAYVKKHQIADDINYIAVRCNTGGGKKYV